jgi:putative ABC transport system substrate-binding protein
MHRSKRPLGSITKSAASHDVARSPASVAGIGCRRETGRIDDAAAGVHRGTRERGRVPSSGVARAQQGDRVRRIGVLMNGTAVEATSQAELAAFVQGLRQLGWIDGQNVRIEVRWGGPDPTLQRIYAAQLIGLMPDVIVAASTPSLTVIREATSTMPVVFVRVSDPVAQGFVADLRQPGGNITGFSAYEFSIGGKWLGLLKEIAPALSRVAVMFNPDSNAFQFKFFFSAMEAAAPALRVQVITMPVRSADIESALSGFSQQPNSGLALPTFTPGFGRQKLIADLAVRYRLPSISSTRFAHDFGGLMDYGISGGYVGQFAQAAGYVDRILKGTKPADLPKKRTRKSWNSSRRPQSSRNNVPAVY